jgi:nucleoid-associated protein YgaU
VRYDAPVAARFLLIFFVGTVLAVVIATAPQQTDSQVQAGVTEAAVDRAEQKRAVEDEKAKIRRSLATAAPGPIQAPRDPKAVLGSPGLQDRSATPPSKQVKKGPPVKPAIRTITVRKGDSLTRIALREYGSAKKMNLIYEANRSKIPDKNDLKVGMTLVVPNRPGR